MPKPVMTNCWPTNSNIKTREGEQQNERIQHERIHELHPKAKLAIMAARLTKSSLNYYATYVLEGLAQRYKKC